VYGRYSKAVAVDGNDLVVEGRKVRTMRSREPAELPWSELSVDLVFECTGISTRRADLEKHIRAGARFVLLSPPSHGGEVETVVHGANVPRSTASIISCASCTTNCITPLVEVIGRRIGVEKAVMTTVHAYTSSQPVVDGPRRQFRRGRAAGANLVPTTTGAALANDVRAAAVRGPVRRDRPAGARSHRFDCRHYVARLAEDQRRRGEPGPHGRGRN
jgi:glyceraldehyde 3-phosphate dehydrogenase